MNCSNIYRRSASSFTNICMPWPSNDHLSSRMINASAHEALVDALDSANELVAVQLSSWASVGLSFADAHKQITYRI